MYSFMSESLKFTSSIMYERDISMFFNVPSVVSFFLFILVLLRKHLLVSYSTYIRDHI